MPPLDPIFRPTSSPEFWRSLDERAGTSEFRAFLEREFHGLPLPDAGSFDRRRFLQLMGASFALAGLSGCWGQKSYIAPAKTRPVERIPGVPQRFATCMELGGVAQRLFVTSYDGRPIKVEGCPSVARGGTSLLAQASVLELYDPDRSREVLLIDSSGRDRIVKTWDDFLVFAKPLMERFREAGGRGLAVLSEASSSLTLAAVRETLQQRFPEAVWCEYEPLSWDHEREGVRRATGRPGRPVYALDRAPVVACFDADPLGLHRNAVEQMHAFSRNRAPENGWMGRLYSFESTFSLTGANADHRFPVPSRLIPSILRALHEELYGDVAGRAIERLPLPEATRRALAVLLKDLRAARDEALAMAGPNQPPEAHELALSLCGARNVYFAGDPRPAVSGVRKEERSHLEGLRALTRQMAEGRIDFLVVLGGNPVYDAPVDLDFAGALKKVEHRAHLSLHVDETSRHCTWQLPRAHYLESWGDARDYEGLVCLQQPLIEPLYGGKTPAELLAALIGNDVLKGYDLVRRAVEPFVAEGGDFERSWRHAVHEGFVANSRPPLFPHEPRPVPKSVQAADPRPASLELVFRADAKVYDGRFANNGWLQELPDPLTKVTWENVALFAPATARELGVANETMVRLKYLGRDLELPAYVMPGQAPGTIGVSLGYGRTAAGHVGGHDEWGAAIVGSNAFALRTADAPWGGEGVVVEATGRRRPLAVTQNHHAIDTVGMKERGHRVKQLVREGTLAQFANDPAFAQRIGHRAEEFSLWKEHRYDGHKWGMAIDLSRCTGCSACVLACQAENNIPIVGRENVRIGREMHWLRIDRYFRGDEDAPSVAQQPVACHHCELAPCEQVCPVAATVHDREGLNSMVYNRCVGTRYCSNNCPYKVRRFNFFNYQKRLENDPQQEVCKLAHNPEVTVRARGVMEKCSYCLQRIQAAKLQAKNEGRPVRDGEVVPACMQACPTGAISFGDLNDRRSEVAARQSSPRAYGMLAELNVRPRTQYLARVRNPHPDLTGRQERGARSEDA